MTLKVPMTARAELTDHLEQIEQLIRRHRNTQAAMVARMAERDQVIARLLALRDDYQLCLSVLPAELSDSLDLSDLPLIPDAA